MGKRKSRKIVKAKRFDKLETSFDCPFCNHHGVIEVKLERPRKQGFLACRICGTKYSKRISALCEPVDVYSDWIDKCHEQNIELPEQTSPSPGVLNDESPRTVRGASSTNALEDINNHFGGGDAEDNEVEIPSSEDEEEEGVVTARRAKRKKKKKRLKRRHGSENDLTTPDNPPSEALFH